MSEEEETTETNETERKCDLKNLVIPKRYVVALMVFFGFMLMFALRVNLNVAISAMEKEFHWDSETKGIILGSFFYGYIVLQVPGGYLSLKFGGVRVFGFALFISSLLSMLTEPAARISVEALVALRVAEGLAMGVVLPSSIAIWSKWAPPFERTTLVATGLTGSQVGTITAMPLSGVLSEYGFGGGWPSVFYCFGLSGIVWYALWFFLIYDSPENDPTISETERTYIISTIKEVEVEQEASLYVPWRYILSSVPVWGIILGAVSKNWGSYLFIISLPTFVVDVLHFNIMSAGFLSALPFLLKSIAAPLCGIFADWLRVNHMSTLRVRQYYFAFGSLLSGLFTLLVGYTTHATVAMTLFCLAAAVSASLLVTYSVSTLDIAPKFSCVIMGLCNTLSTCTGFLVPMIVGLITPNKTMGEWRLVFWITFLISVAGTVFYCGMIEGEKQPWADINSSEDEKKLRKSMSSKGKNQEDDA